MKLDELLKQITPLPYSLNPPGPHSPASAKTFIEGDELVVAHITNGQSTKAEADARYLVHAANQLPGCAATLRECLDATIIHYDALTLAFVNPPPEIADVLDGLAITISKLTTTLADAETFPPSV